jgi:hypothetical protein
MAAFCASGPESGRILDLTAFETVNQPQAGNVGRQAAALY